MNTPQTNTARFSFQQACLEGMRPERMLVDAFLCKTIEEEREEWKQIAKEALSSFKCTQTPDDYPDGHWSRRAVSLFEA